MFCVIRNKFSSMSSRIAIVCMLAVLLVVSLGSDGLCSQPKQVEDKPDDYDFVFVNNSGYTVRNIWIRHPSTSHRGEINIRSSEGKVKLNGGKLKNGESVNIALPRKKGASYLSKTKGHHYNISVELPYEVENYKYWTWRNIDFAGVYKIEFTKENGHLHMTRFVSE